MEITVRTPAGASSTFPLESEDTADQLADRAVQHFMVQAQLEPGSFRLALLRGTRIVDLAVEARVTEAGVADGDVLHLITCEPQVDG